MRRGPPSRRRGWRRGRVRRRDRARSPLGAPPPSMSSSRAACRSAVKPPLAPARDVWLAAAQGLDQDLGRGGGDRARVGVDGESRVEAGLEGMVGEQAVAEAVNGLQPEPREDGGEALGAPGEVETREKRPARSRGPAPVLHGQLAEEHPRRRPSPRRGLGEVIATVPSAARAAISEGLRGERAVRLRRSSSSAAAPSQPGPRSQSRDAHQARGLSGAGAGFERDRPHELGNREVARRPIGEYDVSWGRPAHSPPDPQRDVADRATERVARRRLPFFRRPSGCPARASPEGEGGVSRRARTQRSSRSREPLSPCRQATRTSQ